MPSKEPIGFRRRRVELRYCALGRTRLSERARYGAALIVAACVLGFGALAIVATVWALS